MAWHGITLSMDMEVLADLFQDSFGVMRQVEEGFTSSHFCWHSNYLHCFVVARVLIVDICEDPQSLSDVNFSASQLIEEINFS